MYLNKVFIFGNLTREPELRSLPSGNKVAQMGVATNRVWKDQNGKKQESTEFHNVVVFGRQAEIAAQYLKKGSSVFLEGRLQTRSWEAEGQKKYRTEIVVDRMQFGPRAGSGGTGGGSSQGEEDQSPAAGGKGGSSGGAIEYPEEEINPDDIPF
jgi:single-strand DNA-binding protein